MKLVKLDRRHNLYHKGYTYAFRVNRWAHDSNKIERVVKELEGWRWDNTFWGKYRDGVRPYYIGVRNESTATMVLLKL
jgi:hypothetical protein